MTFKLLKIPSSPVSSSPNLWFFISKFNKNRRNEKQRKNMWVKSKRIRKKGLLRGHKQRKPNYIQSIYFSPKGKTPIISVYSSLFIVIMYICIWFAFKCHFSYLMQMPVCFSFLSFSIMSSLIWLWLAL